MAEIIAISNVRYLTSYLVIAKCYNHVGITIMLSKFDSED